MTEFERQMAARLQAQAFLLTALIRDHLHHMEPREAAALMQDLRRQFATLRIPQDADPQADLDQVMAMHRDAQFFLDRILESADPHRHA